VIGTLGDGSPVASTGLADGLTLGAELLTIAVGELAGTGVGVARGLAQPPMSRPATTSASTPTRLDIDPPSTFASTSTNVAGRAPARSVP
jgi:hypothetical protein